MPKYIYIKIGTMPLSKVLHVRGRLKVGEIIEVKKLLFGTTHKCVIKSCRLKHNVDHFSSQRLYIDKLDDDVIKASKI